MNPRSVVVVRRGIAYTHTQYGYSANVVGELRDVLPRFPRARQAPREGVRMEENASVSAASEAARALARQRWGTQAIDRMIGELFERSNEIGTRQLSELRRLVGSFSN